MLELILAPARLNIIQDGKIYHLLNTKMLIIPVTRRLEGYTKFVGRYVTGRRKRFRPHKVYIFLIRITSRVDLSMSVCPSVWDLGNYKS